MFCYVVRTNWAEMAALVCKQGNLLTVQNIDFFLDYAIEKQAYEIQVILMQEKQRLGGHKSIEETTQEMFNLD